MDAPPLLVEQRGHVRWLWLNRPHRRNALDFELTTLLHTALIDAESDAQTRVIVLAGKGPSFCSGADLRYLLSLKQSGSDPLVFLRIVVSCCDQIERVPKPVVAAVHGHVVAGGLELALACDVVVAVAGTLIGDGHIRNGLVPGGGASMRLPRKVGEPLARWLMLTGQLLPADDFVRTGFVRCIVAANEFESSVESETAVHVEADSRTQTAVKGLLDRSRSRSRREGQERELRTFARHWSSPELESSLEAFG